MSLFVKYTATIWAEVEDGEVVNVRGSGPHLDGAVIKNDGKRVFGAVASHAVTVAETATWPAWGID